MAVTRSTTPGIAPSSMSAPAAPRMAALTRLTPSGAGSRRAAISQGGLVPICCLLLLRFPPLTVATLPWFHCLMDLGV